VNEYDRYRADADVLAAVGQTLRHQLPTQVVLPEELRRAALAAWQRDEQGSPPAQETPEQRNLRAAAATLALIGLAVLQAEPSSPVQLSPETFAEAVAAAKR
jgi:hypothetical protein